MSNTVGSILGDFFEGLIAPIRIFFNWVKWTGVVIVGFFSVLLKFAWEGVQILFNQMIGLPDLVSSTQSAIASGGQLTGFPLFIVTINTFFPLDLCVAYISLLIQLWIFWIIYRFVKSWIPTLS